MRKSLSLISLLSVALGGCALFGGGRSVDAGELGPRRTTPLVIPTDFTLPPPGQASATAPAR